MNTRMNVKLKLVMELVTILYLLLCELLSKRHLIGSNLITFPTIIWIIIWVIISLYNKKLSGITDELLISILAKVNNISVHFLMISIGIFGIFLVSPYNKNIIFSNATVGNYLMLILLITTVIRLLSFIYYDKRGIYK